MIKKVVILAGGMGTRFLPASKTYPKEMLPIIGKPVMQIIIEEIIKSGINDIIIVISPNKLEIKDYFSSNETINSFLKKVVKEHLLDSLNNILNNCKITFVIQEEANGSGGALLLTEKYIGNNPFIMVNGDDILINNNYPVIKQLKHKYEEEKASIIAFKEIPLKDVDKYGILKLGSNNQVKAIVEKPNIENAPSRYANLGYYVFTPAIFNKLKKIKISGNEYLLTDAISLLLEDEKVFGTNLDCEYHSVGNNIQYIKTLLSFAMKDENMKQELIEWFETNKKANS